jgi:DNA-directed RNA polymerase subunit E'/Rpb7
MDQNIVQHLHKELERLCVGECSEEYGHILAIQNIRDAKNIDGTAFLIEFDAEVLKPTPGSEFTGKVCLVFKDGILVNIADKQKILIPTAKLAPYVLDPVQNIYKHGKKSIAVGDDVRVSVLSAKYMDQNFCCFGKLV